MQPPAPTIAPTHEASATSTRRCARVLPRWLSGRGGRATDGSTSVPRAGVPGLRPARSSPCSKSDAASGQFHITTCARTAKAHVGGTAPPRPFW
eukprot:2963494-Prymnesium_polylepis.1